MHEAIKALALCLASAALISMVVSEHDSENAITVFQDKKLLHPRKFPKGEEDYSKYGDNILMFKR